MSTGRYQCQPEGPNDNTTSTRRYKCQPNSTNVNQMVQMSAKRYVNQKVYMSTRRYKCQPEHTNVNQNIQMTTQLQPEGTNVNKNTQISTDTPIDIHINNKAYVTIRRYMLYSQQVEMMTGRYSKYTHQPNSTDVISIPYFCIIILKQWLQFCPLLSSTCRPITA